MGRFGDTLKTSIKISGLKYANISQRINFDSSYISKWINSGLLPSPKIISSICEELTKLLLDQLNENDLNALFTELNITYSNDLKSSSQTLYNKFYEDYLLDSNEKNQIEKSTQSSQDSSSNEQFFKNRNIILQKISKYREISNSIKISIIGDLFHCSPDDIIFLMDIKSEIARLNFKNVDFKIFISDESITNSNRELTGITLINFFMIPCNFYISYYSVKTLNSGLIINIDNLLNYTAQAYYNDTWLIENYAEKIKQTNLVSKVIEKDLLPVGRDLFDTYNTSSPNYIQSMVTVFSLRQTGVILGTLDTFFLTSELLECLLDMCDPLSQESQIYWLKKHTINEDRINNGEKINYIIYRNALDKLVYKGIIRLFEKEFVLPVELRIKVLECINEKLEIFDNINIKIVDSYLVDEIKHEPLPNIYISPTKAYFLTSSINSSFKFCYLKNNSFIEFLNRTFCNIWDEQKVNLIDGNNIIEEYLNICQEILFFELI